MRSIFILSLLLLLVACTSAVETLKLARTQTIMVNTPFADGAKCNLTDARGRKWHVRKTPDVVAVEDGHSPIRIICKKKGFKTTTVAIREGKQELLTIDGKRVTLGIFDQFPNKAPRLIPKAIKEVSSFALDPTGEISTEYPEEVTVWMEPLVWPTEEDMRGWAYERRIWMDEQYFIAEDIRIEDDARKVVRREKKQAREEAREEFYEDVKDFGRKAVDPDTYIEPLTEGAGKVAKGVGHAVDPRRPLNWMYDKSKEMYPGPDSDSKWVPSTESKVGTDQHPKGWVPSWLRITPSTKAKRGYEQPAARITDMPVENIEPARPVAPARTYSDDVAPWVRERGDRVE